MKNYLVTGAAGFIGSYVVKKLLDRGDRVWGIDNLNHYYDPRLKDYRCGVLRDRYSSEQFKFKTMDVGDLKNILEFLGDTHIDGIFNLAAMAGVRYSIQEPQKYIDTNITGTLNLLELAKLRSIKSFNLASTSSLYSGQPLPFDESLPVNTPLSPYASSKKAAEVLCYTYHHLYGINVSINRFFTVYGPAGRPDMSYFRFIQCIDNGYPIQINGDGTQSRDFTYVEDIAAGVVKSIEIQGYEIINLGGGKKPYSVNSMIEIIEGLLGKKAKKEMRNFHKADMKVTWADISKAKRLLDWEPKVGLEEGLKLSCEWYQMNHSFVNSLTRISEE